jgi:3-methylfumaryl-CoA hydratase
MLNQTQTQTDVMDVARARALQATLGAVPSIDFGHRLPPFFHQIYFWDAQTAAALGRDGHPATPAFIGDLGLPRRMWAAGKCVFHNPLFAGSKATRTSMIEGVTRKDGRSGPLAFVRLRHDIKQRGALALSEWQELVYRPDENSAPPDPQVAPTDETATRQMTYDSTHLFRYSALTFNGHRIHYDADYARNVEGYAGLVVHGPLHAHMLMALAEAQMGPLTEFSYRAVSPVIVGEAVAYCWKDGALWARGTDGRLVMSGVAKGG